MIRHLRIRRNSSFNSSNVKQMFNLILKWWIRSFYYRNCLDEKLIKILRKIVVVYYHIKHKITRLHYFEQGRYCKRTISTHGIVYIWSIKRIHFLQKCKMVTEHQTNKLNLRLFSQTEAVSEQQMYMHYGDSTPGKLLKYHLFLTLVY